MSRIQGLGLGLIKILNERETSERKKQHRFKELEMFIFALVFEYSLLSFQEFSHSEVRLEIWRPQDGTLPKEIFSAKHGRSLYMMAMVALRAFYCNRTRTMSSEELSQLVKTGQPADHYSPDKKCLRDTIFEHMMRIYKSPIDLDQVLV